MKDHLLWILGVLALVLAWFVCMRTPGPATPAAIPTPHAVAAPAPAPVPAPATPPPALVVATPARAAFAVQADGKVWIEGALRDDATRAAVLERATAIYGTERIVDRLTVESNRGDLDTLVLSGEQSSAADKTAIVDKIKRAFAAGGVNVTIDDRMTVAAKTQQARIDDFLKGKIVLFETNSPLLTQAGRRVLDELVPILESDPAAKIQVQGHTDNIGVPVMNQQLSEARARVTANYLIAKNIRADRLSSSGFGQSQPVADNATLEGRQLNRRIEFKVGGN